LFSLKGRLGRLRYLAWIWVGVTLPAIPTALGLRFFPRHPVTGWWVKAMGFVAMLWFVSCGVRRLHDGHHSGAWALVFVSPFVCALIMWLIEKHISHDTF
jgi:uncharacterized membrane protein YhaH (DUF805 family)